MTTVVGIVLTAAIGLTAPAETRPLRVGRIDLVSDDIYLPSEVAQARMPLRLLREVMNGLHSTTKPRVVRRELLFHTGDPFDPALLAETERNLREIGFLTNVSITPIDTLPDGTVDIRVRTQETWSLRTELTYSRASGGSERWSVLLSEANFLGEGVQLTAGGGQDEDRHFSNFAYRNQRLFGSPWQATGSYSGLSDGSLLLASLGRPFHAQEDPWSLEVEGWRKTFEARFYLSNAGSDPARARSLYAKIPEHDRGVRVRFLRRVSPALTGRVWRVGGGVEVTDIDYDLLSGQIPLSDGRRVDLGYLTVPGSPLSRDAATVAGPFLALESEGRLWITGSYLLRYGRVEDVPLDPFYGGRVGWSRRVWGGGGPDRMVAEVRGGDWSRLGSGLVVVDGVGHATAGRGAGSSADVDLVAGWLGRQTGSLLSRVFVEGAWGDHLVGSDAFILGLGRGLRTLEFDGMAGDRLVRWTAEENLLLPGEPLGFYKVGLAAYYAGGAAWWHDESRGLGSARNEVGIGLRFGSSRSARADLARVDVSWPFGNHGGAVLTAVTGGWF